MKKITLNKADLVKQYLSPISRVSEECSLVVKSNSISTLLNDETESIILYAKHDIETGLDVDDVVKLNFKNLRKFIKVLDCIKDDIITLNVSDDGRIISHKSSSISFKLHLVMDRIIKQCTVDLNKVSSLTFDTEFTTSYDKIREILKGSVVANETEKVYFYTKDGNVYAELADKNLKEIDSMDFNVVDNYTGSPISTPLPFNIDILKIVSGNKFENINIKINNTYKVLLFEVQEPQIMFKYIMPGYTK